MAILYGLLFFVLFLFFSLALLKRYAELYNAQLENKASIIGRAYQLMDSRRLVFLGKTSAYLAILTFISISTQKRCCLFTKAPSYCG